MAKSVVVADITLVTATLTAGALAVLVPVWNAPKPISAAWFSYGMVIVIPVVGGIAAVVGARGISQSASRGVPWYVRWAILTVLLVSTGIWAYRSYLLHQRQAWDVQESAKAGLPTAPLKSDVLKCPDGNRNCELAKKAIARVT